MPLNYIASLIIDKNIVLSYRNINWGIKRSFRLCPG